MPCRSRATQPCNDRTLTPEAASEDSWSESKIKGHSSRRANKHGLHVGWRSTRQEARAAARSSNPEDF